MKSGITHTELQQLLDAHKNIMVIDVRSRDEYRENHIPFAGNLRVDLVESGDFVPEPGKIIVTACGKGGGRSERAAKYLRDHFANEVYFLEGGTFGWLENQERSNVSALSEINP